MGIIKKLLPLLTGSTKANPELKRLTDRQLIELEAKIGGELFGPVPAGHRREFFCLDDRTWVWHEEWNDVDGKRHVTSTRYEIHEHGILKAQDGKVYKFIEGEELKNLMIAVRLYYETISRDLYHRDPATGQRLQDSSPATM